MADIASADVTYVLQSTRKALGAGGGRNTTVVKVTYGDGSLTYPSGGVPLDKGKLGCPTFLESLVLADENDGSGLVWKWDKENNKLRAYDPTLTVNSAGSIGSNMEIGLSADAASATVEGGTGVTAQRVLTGPVKLTELGNVAVAAQTLYVIATGY